MGSRQQNEEAAATTPTYLQNQSWLLNELIRLRNNY